MKNVIKRPASAAVATLAALSVIIPSAALASEGAPRADDTFSVRWEQNVYTGRAGGVKVCDYTGTLNTASASAVREVTSCLRSLQSLAEAEIAAVLNDDNANPERLPVALEIVEIGEHFTYIFTIAEGEDPVAYVLESSGNSAAETPGDTPAPAPVQSMLSAMHSHFDPVSYAGNGNGAAAAEPPVKAFPAYTTRGRITPKHNFSDGLGVRLPIMGRGSVLSFTVLTSGGDTVPPTGSDGQILAGGANFLYGGFDGTVPGVGDITTDMGLIYQRMYGSETYAWKPVYLVKYGKADITGPTAVEGGAFSANGYIPGKAIEMEIRIDPVPSDPEMDRVLLRTAGYAFHESSSGSGGPSYLVQLSYSDFRRIKTPFDWRLLATSVIPDNNGSGIAHCYAYGYFRDILLDGSLPDFMEIDYFHGYAENPGEGCYYLQVCRGFGEVKRGR